MSLKMKAKTQNDADIWVYGDIGESWSECITAKEFAEELKKLGDVKNITLHINSAGGSVFDGLSIYNVLKKHPANIVTEIDGMALSIASIIALAGDTVKMAGNAMYMIHNPWTYEMGDSRKMRETADKLDKVRGSILGTYLSKIKDKATSEEVSDFMDAETWFSAQEAKDYGFIDEITDPIEIEAKCDLTKYHFKNMPVNKNIEKVAMKDSDAFRVRLARMAMKVQQRRLANS